MALTKFLGLTVCFISKLAKERVLLREEHLHVLHADVDDSGSDVGAQCVNTLEKDIRVGQGLNLLFHTHSLSSSEKSM